MANRCTVLVVLMVLFCKNRKDLGLSTQVHVGQHHLALHRLLIMLYVEEVTKSESSSSPRSAEFLDPCEPSGSRNLPSGDSRIVTLRPSAGTRAASSSQGRTWAFGDPSFAVGGSWPPRGRGVPFC